MGSQFWLFQVAPRQVDPSDMQFASNSHRHRIQVRIEDVELRVPNWLSDWHDGKPGIRLARPVAYIDGGFRRSVQVVQFGSQPLEEPQLQLEGQCLATTNYSTQRCATFHTLRFQEDSQHRGNEMYRRDLLLNDEAYKIVWILVALWACYHQARSGHQRPEELPYRHVETVGGLLQYPIAAIETIRILHP